MAIVAVFALLALFSIISIVLSAEEPDHLSDPRHSPYLWTCSVAARRDPQPIPSMPRHPPGHRVISWRGSSPLPVRPMSQPRGSAPAGRCASRHVTPSRPTTASCARAGGQLQAIAGHEVDGIVAIGQAEPDRTRRAHQHLVVAVGVGGVAVARAVRPGPGVEALGPQARGGIGGRHG